MAETAPNDFAAFQTALSARIGVATTIDKTIVELIARAGDLIFEPTRRHLDAYLLEIFAGNVELAPSGMTDSNAAILGAAALAWQELEGPHS